MLFRYTVYVYRDHLRKTKYGAHSVFVWAHQPPYAKRRSVHEVQNAVPLSRHPTVGVQHNFQSP